MTRRFTQSMMVAVAVLATATVRAQAPVTAILPDTDFPLVISAAEISGPRVVSRGFETSVAWSQTDKTGRLRVHLARMKDTRLQPRLAEEAAVPTDSSRSGNNLYPDVALRPDGTPGILWVNVTPDHNLLLYSDGTHPVAAISTTKNSIGTPVLTYDERGSAYAAWTETVGGKSLIMAGTKPADGDWAIGPLSFGERPFDLFPQIFGGSRTADLYCYGQKDERYIGRRLTLRVNGAPAENPLPDDIPAARLPILYRNSSKNVGAIWLEQTDFGELHFDLNPSVTGERQLQELTASSGAISQVAVAHDDSGAKVWTETNSSDTTSITVVGGDGRARHFEAIGGGVSTPTVSSSANFLHVLWVSELATDGSNSLVYRRLPK